MVAGKIPLAAPNLGPLEAEYVQQAVSSGWVGPDGPFVERFEGMVAKAAGRKWAVATLTGTEALRAAAVVLGFRKDATKFAEVNRNAYPAMANVLKAFGWELRYRDGGFGHDIEPYDCGYFSVVDRAPAIGEQPDKLATLECYSFAANKTVTCGQGGAVVGDDAHLQNAVRWEATNAHGMTNARMANLNAALGCAQMERLDELKEPKQRIWNRYKEAGLPMVERGASRWMATVDMPYRRFDEFDEFKPRMEPWGVMSIPCGTGLTEAEQDTVIRCLTSRT